VVIVAVFLFPVIWVVDASFQTTSELFVPAPHLFPAHTTLRNYAVFGSQLRPLVTTIVIASAVALLTLLVGIPAAYALDSFRWRFGSALVFVLLLVQMVPSVMLATPLFLVFSKIGLLNSIPGLVIADSAQGIPFTILVLMAFLSRLPRELREAATVDGAGNWRTLRSVIVPATRTAVIATGMFAFLFAWGDFIFALTMSTTGTVTPITLSIYELVGAYNIDWGSIMAAATIAVIPGVLFLVFAQRYIATGLTAGAVTE
jgi:multiple sugar transport system permease protein